MNKKYRVVLLGTMVEKEAFVQNMSKLGVSRPVVDRYIQKAPVVVKRNLALPYARKYADTIINAGGIVNIQETGEFPQTNPNSDRDDIPLAKDFVLCPNCGFKQHKGDLCLRCGFNLNSAR